MKKLISLLFILIFLTGCNSSNPTTTPTTEIPTAEIPTTEIPTEAPITTEIPTATEPVYDKNGIYASANGSGNGSFNNPYSLKNALLNMTKEKALYLFGGTYNVKESISLEKNGDEDNYYKIFAYNDERVVFDYGYDYDANPNKLGYYNKYAYKGIVILGSYYHIKGIEITNCRSSGMQIVGHYNIVENCIFSFNGNTGCNISSSSSKAINDWPHNNLIKNCTSYGNYDWDRLDGNEGEDADGFGCKLTSGRGNVFDGCIAYNNSDDGWDLFTKHKTGVIGEVTFRNCVAFSNGYALDGTELKNGNGFKLGGRALEVSHTMTNCVAFNNKANGFDDNSNPGTITLTDCTGYNNGTRNFAMGRFLEEANTYTSTWTEDGEAFGPIEGVPQSHNIFENCISYKSGIKDSFSGYATNCYFDSLNGYYKFVNYSV